MGSKTFEMEHKICQETPQTVLKKKKKWRRIKAYFRVVSYNYQYIKCATYEVGRMSIKNPSYYISHGINFKSLIAISNTKVWFYL